jgi:hypothetical protein
MKKVLATILAFVYLSSSMGATIHLHYCMGKLASWSLVNHERKNCERCGMVKKTTSSQNMADNKDCCRDEYKQIKTDKDQQLFPSEYFKYNNLTQAITLSESSLESIKVFSFPIEFPSTNAPPLFDKVSRFIVFRNFRL